MKKYSWLIAYQFSLENGAHGFGNAEYQNARKNIFKKYQEVLDLKKILIEDLKKNQNIEIENLIILNFMFIGEI